MRKIRFSESQIVAALKEHESGKKAESSELTLDTHMYAAGIYFVFVSNSETHYSQKLVITK